MQRSMMLSFLICALFCLSLSAQDLKSANLAKTLNPMKGSAASYSAETSSQPAESNGATAVMLDDPVITIRGLCSADAEKADPELCSTIVTRREFDALLSAVNVSGQKVSSLARQNFAKGYVLYAAFEQAARRAGFEDTEQFADIMRWARLRAVTDAYRGKIVEEARTAQQTAVDAYYRDHFALYDRISVMMVSLPRKPPAGFADHDFDQRTSAVMRDARERMVRGDDPAQIQKDCYSALHLSGVPLVDLQTRKRSDFSETVTEELLSLKPGDVSQIESEADSFVVYKIVSHQPLPEAKVQPEIVRAIAEDRVKQAFNSIGNSVHAEYNLNYFGPPENAPVPPH